MMPNKTRKARVSAPAAGAGAAKGPTIDPDGRKAINEGTTWGLVESYAVDADRLMIKLNAGAIAHLLVSLAADAPHFRTVVAMTMMAHHTRTRLTVRYAKPLNQLGGRPDVNLPSSGPEILRALEVGIGYEFDKALSFDDWPIELPS
jgi:hypothetical protein